MRQELVLGGRGLRAEGGDDGGARGAVLDRHPHARALPRLGQDLFLKYRAACKVEYPKQLDKKIRKKRVS